MDLPSHHRSHAPVPGTSRIAAALGGLVVLGLVLTGCGGGGATAPTSADSGSAATSPSSSPTAAITIADFVARANAICTTGAGQIGTAANDVDPNDREAQVAFIGGTLVPIAQGEVDDIRALGTPDGKEAIVSGIVTALQASVDRVQADPGSLLPGGTYDPTALNAQLDRFGLTACGSGDSGASSATPTPRPTTRPSATRR